MYLTLDQVRNIQVDHTSRCNLRCPQCARTQPDGSVNEKLKPFKDLAVSDYQQILQPFAGRMVRLFYCGNYGDAAASPTFDEVIEYCVSDFPNVNHVLVTNGSLRDELWWARLAQLFSKTTNSKVYFSVDGLRDTNAVYRVNSNFDKIIANMRAFISAGGYARWDYLVFSHNHHQVEQAKALAKEIGVKEFNVKNTSRFVNTDKEKAETTVKTKKSHIHDLSDNLNAKKFLKIRKEYDSFLDYASKTKITCKTQLDRTLYIDFNKRVWPCCWLGAPSLFKDNDERQAQHIAKLFDRYGYDFNRFDVHGWGVLDHVFFREDLEESWHNDFAGDPARLFTCGRTCGQKYEYSSGYGENKKITIITS